MPVVEIESPLTPDECADRLRQVTGSDGILTWFGTFTSRPVVGQVSRREVRIRKQIIYGNSYQPILTGTLEASENGAMFRGRAGIRKSVVVFMVAWFGMVGLGAGVVTLLAIGEMLGITLGTAPGEGDGPLWPVAAFSLFLLACGYGGVRFSRWLARDEERFLIDLVRDTICPAVPFDRPDRA